ncbi:hypothetical protein [Geobacter sp. AOG1]|uniref:hypothetical protein n=1 Tax=Geobacter sp. AOG1 TaxID=1566346 RepID=UPI001CC41284|nr:hypothetical protein [Geobacter sp. AOG1]
MNKIEPTKILHGDRFVTMEDIKTHVAVSWAAPYTGGYDCVIPKGIVLVAIRDQRDGSLAFSCIPVNYQELEKVFVPASDRFELKYAGYHFAFTNTDVGVRLQLVSRSSANERRRYEAREKVSDLFRDNIFLQSFKIIFIYAFIILTLPIKPFVDMIRKRRLTAKKKAEESE